MSFWFPIVQAQFYSSVKTLGFHLFRARIINRCVPSLLHAAMECTLPEQIWSVSLVIDLRSGLWWVA